MKAQLLSALAQRKQRVLELQTGLTSFPAFSPISGGVGEWKKAQWLEQKLREWGINDIERVDADDPRAEGGKRPNLIVRVPGKTPRMLWILAHIDVVPPGELELWNTDPWTVTVDPKDTDIIRGRGVEDNQQAVVAGCLLAAELVEQGITPDLGLGLIIVSDEEAGNTFGVDYVFQQQPNLVHPDDLVMVPDFGNAEGDLIEVAEKGVLWLKVSVKGQQCHASSPAMGKNALVAASDMILHVADVEKQFNAYDPLFTPPTSTMTPTRHDANVPNINTMPGKDVFYIDCRILPCYSLEDVHAAMQKLGDAIAEKYGVSVDVEIANIEPIFPPTDPNSEVVQKLMTAVKSVYNIDCRASGVGGSTVAGRLRRHGIPAAVWSRAIPNYHEPNEGSRISYNVGDSMVYAHLLFN